MATFAPRPDGLFDVTLDSGLVLPMALPEQSLLSAGLQPAMPPPPPVTQTQGLAQAAPWEVGPQQSLPDVGPNMSPAPQQSLPPPGPPPAPPRPTQNVPMIPLQVDPAEQQRARDASIVDRPPPAPKKLIPVTGAGAPGAQRPSTPEEQVQAQTDVYLQGLLRPRPASVTKIPAHDELLGYSVKKGAEIDPEKEADVDIQDEALQEAVRERARIEAGRQAVQGGMQAREAERQEEELANAQMLRREKDEDISRRRTAVDKRSAEVAEMAPDPGKFFHDRGAVATLLAGVGAAMGTYASVKTGAPNFALQILNDGVQREYDAQVRAIEQADKGVDRQRLALADMIRDHGDPRTAELEFKMMARDIAALKIEATAVKSGSAETMARAEQVIAEMRKMSAEDKLKLDLAMQDDVQQTWRHVPQKTIGGGGPPDPLKAMQKAAAYKEAAGKVYGTNAGQIDWKALRQTFVPGEGWAYGEEEGPKLREKKVNVQTIISLADLALQTREEVRSGKIDMVTGARRLTSLKAQAGMAYKGTKEMGAYDKGTKEAWSEIFGNPAEYLSPNPKDWAKSYKTDEQIRTLKERIQAEWDLVRRSQISKDPIRLEPALGETPGSFQEKK